MKKEKEEKQEPLSNELKYTEADMREAFKHGRNFEPLEGYVVLPGVGKGPLQYHRFDSDMDYSTLDEKHRPFYEWLKLRMEK